MGEAGIGRLGQVAMRERAETAGMTEQGTRARA